MDLASLEMEGGHPGTRTAGAGGPQDPAAASLWVTLEGVPVGSEAPTVGGWEMSSPSGLAF